MQTTSTDYKLEIKKPSRSFECRITIGNNIYTNDDIVDIILETIQPGEGFSIGNTPSQTLDLTLLNRGDTIYSTSQVKVEIGLKIGATIEYILMGLFSIDDIEKTDYTTKFTCYDNMIRFETPYFSSLTYPASLQQVVNELATKTGVQFIGSLPAYTVKKLEGFTCREILGYVSSLCGGNALITRDGKFTIVTPKDIDYSITSDNYIDYKREEVKYKIGKVSCKVGDKELNKGSLGTDSMEVKFENPWVTDSILNDIYTKLNGFEYLGYTMKWQGDISLDVGDIVTCTDIKGAVRKIPILSQKFTYNGGLTAEIGAKGETKNKNSFNSSGSGSNKLDRVVTELLIVNEALINKANIQDLEAVSIRTQTIEAKTAAIEVAIIDVAHVSDLTAINANIEKLIAADATMGQAIIGKANITDLTASVGRIEILESSVGDIQTLVNGNLTSNNIQSLILSSDKVTVVNGFIKNAMIENLDVSKINAGDISVNKFRIKSDSGNLLIFDNTIQIKDSTRVRVQIGKDASNDYNIYVWDSSGKLMFDATGLKADGIKNKIIRDDMVSDTANISGNKLNISSVVTSINNGAATLKSSKVHIDGTAQTLDVAFNTLTTKVESDAPTITTDNSIIKLDGAIDGMLKINSIKGRTLQNLSKLTIVNESFDTTSYSVLGTVNRDLLQLGKTYTCILDYDIALTRAEGTGIYAEINCPKSDGSSTWINVFLPIKTTGKGKSIKVFTLPSTSASISSFNVTAHNCAGSCKITNFMTLEGDWTNKPIPPYFEGIRSVGESENLELVSCGKNLFKLPTNITGGAVLIDGGIRFNKATGRTVSIKLPHALKPNTQYTISYKEKGNNAYPFALKFFDETGGVEIHPILNDGYRTLITKNVAMVRVYMFISTSEADNVEVDITNIQIEEGTTPATPEPYKEHRQPITLTNPLRGLPNGVRDIIDFEKGVVVRNIGKVLLDDNVANYSVHTTTDTLIQFRIETLKNKRLHLPVTPVICTHFNYYGNHSLTPSREGIYAINSDDLTFSGICYIAIEKSKLKTLDVAGFVQWLQSNPTTIYYQLATPIEEPIDVEQYMKQFKDGYFLTEGSLIKPIVDLTYSTSLASATSMMKEVTESNTTALNIQQGQISTLISNTTIVKDGVTTQLKDSYNSTVATVDSINSVISSHTSTINNLTGQVLAVDTKTNSVRRDLDGTTATVTAHTASINGLNSTVATQSSSITQLSNQISLKVDGTQVTNIVNGEIDKIEVGGRNLLIGTSSEFRNINTGQWYGRILEYPNEFNSIESFGLKVGDTIVYRIYLKANATLPAKARITYYSDELGGGKVAITGNTISAGTEGYSTVILKITSTILYLSLGVQNGDTSQTTNIVEYKQPKLEKGNKPTDWTQAPEDVDASITAVGDRVTIVSTKAASIETNLNGITSKVSNIETTTSTINGDLKTLTTRMTTAEQKITSDAIVSTVRSSTYYKNDLTGKVSSNEIISCINQTAEAIKISASKINLTGYVTMTNLSTAGQTIIDGGNIKTNTISLERLKSATNNPIIKLFGGCSLDATANNELGVGNAVRLKWDEANYLYVSTNNVSIYQGGVSRYTFSPSAFYVSGGDIVVNSGFIIIGGKKNRGWGFSSGNKYYLGISADDTYVRMYNDDVTVANGVSYLGSPSGRFIKLYSTQAADVSSDRRKKTNILSYDEKIETFYDNLKPISYELINGHSGRKHYGFIAQDVEDAMGVAGLDYKDMALLQKAPMDAEGNEIDPTTIVDYETDERIVDYEYSLAYTEMISINTHMIQKLRAEITQLKKEISEIKGLG